MYVRDYFVELRLLSKEEGAGWIATVPDLPGCMSDGETIEGAAENVSDAIDCWLAAAVRLGRDIPRPIDAQLRRA